MPDRAVESIVACILSFLLGSIPFGLLIARFFKVSDLTSRGSGNIGATNVSRVLGFWPAGLLTLVLDLFKGAIPPFVMGWSAGSGLLGELLGVGPLQFTLFAVWAAVFCAVLGHCFSPWLGFRGGKGVATCFGALLVLSPWVAIVGALGFGLALASNRVGSLSSLTGLWVAALAELILYPLGSYHWMGAALLFVILIRHEDNLDALLENREKSLY